MGLLDTKVRKWTRIIFQYLADLRGIMYKLFVVDPVSILAEVISQTPVRQVLHYKTKGTPPWKKITPLDVLIYDSTCFEFGVQWSY